VIILAIDTCLSACAGAVVKDGAVLAKAIEPMQRGHQERIAGLTAELMAQAGIGFSDLDRIAVTVGPGSFTGLRIGLAFAKGLSVALDIRCAGIGVLAVLGRQAGGASTLAVLDARGGQVHCQAFDGGSPLGPARTLDVGAAAQLRAPDILIGDGASLLAAAFPLARQIVPEACDPSIVAALGAAEPPPPPDPVYMRAAYA
jgi:tRNA threonylcarbamoyladenosine biosynthesis protein TsaB